MRERTASIDDFDDEVTGWRRGPAWMRAHPADALALTALIAGMATILVNATMLQNGAHPAPIFAHKPVPVIVETALPRQRPAETAAAPAAAGAAALRARAELMMQIQRELAKRGFFEGTVDGQYHARMDRAIRDFENTAGLRPSTEPNDALLAAIARSPVKAKPVAAAPARHDPIAALLGPDKRTIALQRALSDYGYGQMRPDGVYGPEMRSAIERFERERRMQVTGQISERLVRELTTVTGRPLD